IVASLGTRTPGASPEQQSCLMLNRTRHLFIRQQTAVINAIRAHFAEFGIVAPVGRNGVETLLNIVADTNDKRIPEIARACLAALGVQLRALKAQILEFDHLIMAWHRPTWSRPHMAPNRPKPRMRVGPLRRGKADHGSRPPLMTHNGHKLRVGSYSLAEASRYRAMLRLACPAWTIPHRSAARSLRAGYRSPRPAA